jgi:hypothetical protein
MNKMDSKIGKNVGIIRCVETCENTFINIKDNIVFAGAPYNKKNFFGNTVKAIGIAPNDVLDSILGIHTSDNHNSVFAASYYAISSDNAENEFSVMADVKIIDVSSLKEKYPELAMRVEILSKYAGIEMPVRAKEKQTLKDSFMQYYIDWMEQY